MTKYYIAGVPYSPRRIRPEGPPVWLLLVGFTFLGCAFWGLFGMFLASFL